MRVLQDSERRRSEGAARRSGDASRLRSMNSSFRRHFDLPASVCYLDAASITPRATHAAAAGIKAIERTVRPWAHRNIDKAPLTKRLRELTATLIGANPGDMALTPAVSYGIATAAANVPLPAGSRVLSLEGDHPSSSLAWHHAARAAGASVETVARPADGDWTRAIVDRIEAAQAPAVSVAALAPLHWSDGARIDLARIAPLLHARGAALVVDATQAAGVLPLDVQQLQPDFLAFPGYKWLLGPYGCAYLYVHPKHQQGMPLEHHMGNRVSPNLTLRDAVRDFSFLPGAQRFDRGERDDALLLSMAVEGLELLHSVPAAERLAHVSALTTRLADGLAGLPASCLPAPLRAPHIVGLQLRGAEALPTAKALEQAQVFTSARLGNLRVAPYLYNDENDIDTFIARLASLLGA
jgi:selenocysteine lyase/cysteine desulfurase